MFTQPRDQTFPPLPSPGGAPVKENRRLDRIPLALPARIELRLDDSTTLNEITRLSDLSAFGAGFVAKKPFKRGRLVLMTLPMPRQLRSYDWHEPQYRVWGVVRRCISVGRTTETPEYSIGLAFIGKNPPSSYIEDPSCLYDLRQRDDASGTLWQVVPADLMIDDSAMPSEHRKQSRFAIPESLRLEITDANGNVVQSETTVTENISLGGAAVFTTLTLERGTFLRVSSDRFGVTILSVVRGTRVGQDGITRLHIEFIDSFFPLEGIA